MKCIGNIFFIGRIVSVFTSHFGSTSHSFEEDPPSRFKAGKHHADW